MAGCSGWLQWLQWLVAAQNINAPNVPTVDPDSTSTPAVTEFAPAPAMELLRSLECPICMEIPLAPIRMYQCQNGHNMCGNCKVKLVTCATCRGNINEARNFAIESVIEVSEFKCPYDGCVEMVKGAEQEAHRSNCRFGPIPCIICGEAKRIPLDKYILHMKEEHKLETIKGNNLALKLRFSTRFPIIRVNGSIAFHSHSHSHSHSLYDEHNFICTVCPNIDHLHCWVALIGVEEAAKKYRAKVICQDSTNSRKMEWNVPVHSIRKQRMDIPSCYHHSGAILPISDAEPFIYKTAFSYCLILDFILEKVTGVQK